MLSSRTAIGGGKGEGQGGGAPDNRRGGDGAESTREINWSPPQPLNGQKFLVDCSCRRAAGGGGGGMGRGGGGSR